MSILLCSCASTRIANIPKGGVCELDDDEIRLWKRANEFREVIEESNFLYNDPALTAYVNEVLDKMTGEYEGKDINMHAFILKDPFFNAFCLANGDIYIHTAIIAEADDETQLATVLGHEATHFLNRHILRQYRSIINKSAFFSFIGTTGAAFGGDLATLLAQYCVLGSVYGYSRDLEREADENSFRLITGLGYPVEETKKIYEYLYEATKDDKDKIPYFYSTHPKIKERIRSFDRLIAEFKKSPEGQSYKSKGQDDARYHQLTKNVLLDNAELEMRCNKLGLARKELEKFNKLWPNEVKAMYLLAKVDLLEGKKDEAETTFKKVNQLFPDFPESRRDLGRLYYKDGKKDLAKQEFLEYLRLKPDAPDAGYIRRYLNE